MQVGTYPIRNFATFGPSELQPPFTGTYIKCLNTCILFISTGQVSVPIHLLSNSQRLVFLLNSRFFFFSINRFYNDYSFFRSYRVNLPSSFNTIILFTLVYSTHLPVAVYSTVIDKLKSIMISFFQKKKKLFY